MVEELYVYGFALVPVIVGMVELLKRAGMPKRYSPVASIVFGLIAGFYYLAPGDPPRAVFFGLVAGLSAVGLYSGTKNTMEELKNKQGAYPQKKAKPNKNTVRRGR